MSALLHTQQGSQLQAGASEDMQRFPGKCVCRLASFFKVNGQEIPFWPFQIYTCASVGTHAEHHRLEGAQAGTRPHQGLSTGTPGTVHRRTSVPMTTTLDRAGFSLHHQATSWARNSPHYTCPTYYDQHTPVCWTSSVLVIWRINPPFHPG